MFISILLILRISMWLISMLIGTIIRYKMMERFPINIKIVFKDMSGKLNLGHEELYTHNFDQ